MKSVVGMIVVFIGLYIIAYSDVYGIFCAKNALLYRVGLRLHCFGNGCRFFGYAFYQTVI